MRELSALGKRARKHATHAAAHVLDGGEVTFSPEFEVPVAVEVPGGGAVVLFGTEMSPVFKTIEIARNFIEFFNGHEFNDYELAREREVSYGGTLHCAGEPVVRYLRGEHWKFRLYIAVKVAIWAKKWAERAKERLYAPGGAGAIAAQADFERNVRQRMA